MFDWLGSLVIAEQTPHRVCLRLAKRSRIAGWIFVLGGVALAIPAWKLWPYFALGPGLLALLGVTLLSLHRQILVDRALGEVHVVQRVFGLGQEMRIPLLHVRAVVIQAKIATWFPGARFVAFLDRRVGDSIYIDESRRAATLLRLVEAIADVAEVRLEYEAADDMANAGFSS